METDPTTMEHLPFVDEHRLAISASPEEVWRALLRVLERPVPSLLARLLGCQDTQAGGPRPLAVGSSIPGFHVTVVDPARHLTLQGRHRFARYALIFRIKVSASQVTLLRAETRADFPGLAGRFYRLLVISTGLHALVARGMLALVGSRAKQ